jgi:hypothetical protein
MLRDLLRAEGFAFDRKHVTTLMRRMGITALYRKPNTSRLKRRGAVYYFRCKIPADLVDHYKKREILESLRTKDPKEALRKVRSRSLQQEEEFDRLRAGLTVEELTEELLETLSKKWVAGVLAEDEGNRVGGWMKQQHVFDWADRLIQ